MCAGMQTFGCLVRRSAPFRQEYERIPSLPSGTDVHFFASRQYCLHLWLLSPQDRERIERGPLFKLSHKAGFCKPADGDPPMKLLRAARERSNGSALSVLEYFMRREEGQTTWHGDHYRARSLS